MNRERDRREETAEVGRALARHQPGLPLRSLGSTFNALRELAGRAVARQAAEAPDLDLQPEPLAKAKRKFSPILWSYILLVLIPAAFATLYFAVIASDQYTAETRFAVRAAEDDRSDQSQNISSLLPGGTGGAPLFAFQDAEIVASYVSSRAVIDDLAGIVDIDAIFRRPEADFLARLPDKATAEDKFDYWRKMVSSYIEKTSGIVTVKVRAFRREDALELARAILEVSERLVNSISLRARADAMRRAEEEVRRADGLMRLALADLAQFRDSEGIIDPVKSADLVTEILLGLMKDKIKIETELFIARRTMSDDAPGVASLRARLQSVDSQIAEMRAKLAGTDPNARNLAAALVRFEELEVKRQFAESMYTFARDGLNRARITAEKQTVYVTVFVPAALPQQMSYPLRFTFSALIALGLSVVWAIGAMIWAAVLDHRL